MGKPLTLDTLVFTLVAGKPIDAHILSRAFGRLAQNAGLVHVRFHELRHTFASLMLQHGAKPKVISEALGHASVGFTMDIYSHIIEGMQKDTMLCWTKFSQMVYIALKIKLTLIVDEMVHNN